MWVDFVQIEKFWENKQICQEKYILGKLWRNLLLLLFYYYQI